jgi:hypothetical protein
MVSNTSITVHLWTGRSQKIKEPLHVGFANASDETLTAFSKHRGPPLVDMDGEVDVIDSLLCRDWLRMVWRGNKTVEEWPPPRRKITARVDVTQERFEVEPVEVWPTILRLFLRDHSQGKTGFCPNPYCPARYFRKTHKADKSCGLPKCARYLRSLSAHKHWHPADTTGSSAA